MGPYKIGQSIAQQIVETVKDVSDQNINFIGTDGIIYASTDQSRIGSFHEVGKQVVLRQETIEVNDEDSYYGTLPGVNIPITYKGEIEGVIGISGSPEDVRKYAYLAQKIAVLLLRELEIQSESASHRNRINYVVQSLIDEAQSRNRRVEQYLSDHRISDSMQYRTILIRLNRRYNPNNLFLIEQTVFQCLAKTGTELYTFHYPNGYLAILPDYLWNKGNVLLNELAGEYRDLLTISAGSSHSIREQYHSYQEAVIAQMGRKQAAVLLYEDLGVEILCSRLEEDLKEQYRDKFLGKLTEQECRLLRTYYMTNLSLTKTGELMFLHKNTIQYQLDKIYEKTGYNPRKFRDATGFYTALLMS